MRHLSRQHPTQAVNVPASERAFNPSIIEHEGARLMAYRVQEHGAAVCSINLAELDKDFQPLDTFALEIPSKQGANLEDPRLFHGPKGTLWLAWTEATYTERTNWKCVQKYGRIEDGKITRAFTPKYGRNDGTAKEKNWQFFTHESRIHAVYSHSPHIVIELDGEKVVREWETPGIMWEHGQPSGGTPPIPFEGGLLTIFHAYESHVEKYRRYNMAAALMQDKPPFAVTEVSTEPIMIGTDKEQMSPDEAWQPLVVFPGGVIGFGYNELAVAIGVNDAVCAITKLSRAGLKLVAPNPDNRDNKRHIKIINPIMIDGIGRNAGDKLTIDKKTARHLERLGSVEIINA